MIILVASSARLWVIVLFVGANCVRLSSKDNLIVGDDAHIVPAFEGVPPTP
ncbi:MAG: hypothetical protein FWE47_02570 [Oscillospiraceae bacterium]|nr:hypothetical protein [Oscillospiraceae bacterium]